MTEYNAANTKHIRAAEKAAKLAALERKGVVIGLMSSASGRKWVWDWLAHCHCFSTPWAGVAATTDFNCGEQNIGLQLLGEVIAAAPDQYIQMMREAADREEANGRRTSSNGSGGDSADDGRDDNGRSDNADGSDSVTSEYTPGPED